MVSDWMPNGTINDFVRGRSDVNIYKLVRFLVQFALNTTQDAHILVVNGRCEGVDLFAWPRNRPRRSQGGMC